MVDVSQLLFTRLQHFTAGPGWKWRAAFWLVLFSLFFQFPAYNYLVAHLTGREIDPFWAHIQEQRHHLLTWTPQPLGSHLEKTAFRLTVPFIAKLLHLGTLGLYLFQFGMGVVMIVLTLRFCEQRCSDRVQALLFTAGLVCTYAGSAAFFDIWGQRDPFGYFFLVVALCTPSPLLVSTATLLSAFADERGLIASAIVLLHHLLNAPPAADTPRKASRVNGPVAAVIAGWAAYFLMRFALMHFRGFRTGTGQVGLEMFFRNLDQLLWGLWSGLEGQWIIVLAFLVLLYRGEGWRWLLPFLGALLLVATAAVLVDDTTRSMAYGFIVLFPAFAWMQRRVHPRQVRMLLFFAFLVSFIHPLYFKLGTGSMIPVDPLFMKVLRVVQQQFALSAG